MTSSRKIAFVHFGKAAGVFVNEYMKQKCVTSYTKYMSHHESLNPLGVSDRDWSKEELCKIAETEEEYAYVTSQMQQCHDVALTVRNYIPRKLSISRSGFPKPINS